MMDAESSRITLVLDAVCRGDPRAASDLLPLVYDELRRLARTRMAREAPGQTLQPTALVHEAYLRITGATDPGWNSRGHFFAAAARAMRRILVEQARRKARGKHGGEHRRADVAVDDLPVVIEKPLGDILAVDDAVRRLEAEDARKGEIVNLRYFAGLTAEETAAALGLSDRTVRREWRFIKVWLKRELEVGEHGG
jgi:RNA polymerase sigma factor (TIGR02999 family)